MSLPRHDSPLGTSGSTSASDLAALLGPPRPLPAALVHPVAVRRADELLDTASTEGRGCGPLVLGAAGPGRLHVRFTHRCPDADAVALQANGWWRPAPADACELRPTGDGWFEGVFEVPADWRASYAFAEHRGTGAPAWREGGMRIADPAIRLVADAGAERRLWGDRPGSPTGGPGADAAGPGRTGPGSTGPGSTGPGSTGPVRDARSVVDLLAPEPWETDGTSGSGDAVFPSPPLHELSTCPGAPRVRWFRTDSVPAGQQAPGVQAAQDGSPAPEESPALEGSPAPGSALDTLPLLVLLDGETHLDELDTPGILARATDLGLLPPLLVVALHSGDRRADVLGVPDGHARFIAEDLLPRLQSGGPDTDANADAPGMPRADPRRTILSGSSFGGLTALLALLQAPELVGAVIAQSVSLWRYQPLALAAPLARLMSAHPEVRIRLQAGRFEGDMIPRAQDLLDAVDESHRPPRLTLTPMSGGHDWAWWQPAMIRELCDLLDTPPS